MSKSNRKGQDGKAGTRKKFLAMARVSSDAQQKEGFSLDVQEDGLKRYAEQNDGEIVKLYRIAETASKVQLRATFHEMIAAAKRLAHEIDALVFYKFDRAARNMFDYVELERLERDYGITFVSVCEPTENTPSGRMQRRMHATFAAYFAERLADDVREGMARRVQNGHIVNKAPYGYTNVRREGRSVIEVNEKEAEVIRRIFRMYAYQSMTLDSIAKTLNDEGIKKTTKQRRWHRATVHRLLLNRVFIGEVPYRGRWYSGVHKPLIDRDTWEKVQSMLGVRAQTTHTLTYAGGLIRCAHCGHTVTGERVVKKNTGKPYTYYRCSFYRRVPDHPPHRVTEAAIDEQVLAMFERLRVGDEDTRAWVAKVLRARTMEERAAAKRQVDDLARQLSRVESQKERLLQLRLDDEIGADEYAEQARAMRDQQARLRGQIEAANRDQDENADVAVKAFELTQHLHAKWVKADYAAKRRILKIVWSNCLLGGEKDGKTLNYSLRKPFDVLAEEVSSNLSTPGGSRTRDLALGPRDDNHFTTRAVRLYQPESFS